jgi:hypothetical protein
LFLAAGTDISAHDHQALREAEINGHQEAARVLREAGSYNPLIPGEAECTLPERTAWKAIREGSTESLETLRDRYQRFWDKRRELLKKDPEPQ